MLLLGPGYTYIQLKISILDFVAMLFQKCHGLYGWILPQLGDQLISNECHVDFLMGEKEGSLRVWLFIYQGWASLALPDLVCPCTTLLTAAFGDCSELLTTGEKPNKYIKGIGTSNHYRQNNYFVNNIAFCI